jgi:hypothetical protein
VTPAAHAVLFHVMDTVVIPRDELADWVSRNLPSTVPQDLTREDCLRAIDELIGQGLLIELSDEDVRADAERWRSEPLPVSWGVDRNRRAGDVDVTEAGFRLMTRPSSRPASGYNDETPDLIRVFGETEGERQLEHVLGRIGDSPWHGPHEEADVEPMRPLGPWWYGRHQLIATGFERPIRRRRAGTRGS